MRHHSFFAIALAHFAGFGAHCAAQCIVAHQRQHGVGKGFGVSFFHHYAVLPVVYYVAWAASEAEGHHRQTASHGFNHHHREAFVVRTHDEHAAAGIFGGNMLGGWVHGGRVAQSGGFYLAHEHVVPFALPEYVQTPVGGVGVALNQCPCIDKAVESFLVVEPADGYHPVRRCVGRCTHRHHCVANHADVGQIAPISAVLFGEHYQTIEATHQPLVGAGAPAVDEAEQPVAAILQAEEFAEVQLEHFAAAVGYRGDEARFRWEERHHYVGTLPHQQLGQAAAMHLASSQIARYLQQRML